MSWILTAGESEPGDLMRRYGLPVVPEDEEVFGKGAKFRIPEHRTATAHIWAAKQMPICQLEQPMHEELRRAAWPSCIMTWS